MTLYWSVGHGYYTIKLISQLLFYFWGYYMSLGMVTWTDRQLFINFYTKEIRHVQGVLIWNMLQKSILNLRYAQYKYFFFKFESVSLMHFLIIFMNLHFIYIHVCIISQVCLNDVTCTCFAYQTDYTKKVLRKKLFHRRCQLKMDIKNASYQGIREILDE